MTDCLVQTTAVIASHSECESNLLPSRLPGNAAHWKQHQQQAFRTGGGNSDPGGAGQAVREDGQAGQTPCGAGWSDWDNTADYEGSDGYYDQCRYDDKCDTVFSGRL